MQQKKPVELPSTVGQFERKKKAFSNWLIALGSDVLPTLNRYEVMRFTTMDGVALVYRNGRDQISSWSPPAAEAYMAFLTNASWRGTKRKRRVKTKSAKQRQDAVRLRDGENCFYCGHPLGDDVTPEHLLSKTHGGSENIANLVLAHSGCNSEAGHLSVMEKVLLRERKQFAGSVKASPSVHL